MPDVVTDPGLIEQLKRASSGQQGGGLTPVSDPGLVEKLKKASEQQHSTRMQRFGQGLADPIYGGAQIGARTAQEGEALGELIMGEEPGKLQRERIQQTDKMVQERERKIQEARPVEERGTTDWYRMGGTAMTEAALAAPLYPVLGAGIAGAAIGGAYGALTEPVAGEGFVSGKTKQVAGGAAGGAVLGAGGKLIGAGIRKVGEFLAREYPENITTQAIDKILRRFGQDEAAGGLSAKQALDVINEADRYGKPVTLSTVGGENVQALAGNVYRQPGESRNIVGQFLDQRDRDSARRLGLDLSEFVHGGPSMHRTVNALVEARSADARPAWDAVRQLQGIWSPRLQQFIEEPRVRQGLARGYELERLRALAENRPFNPTQMGIDLDADGNIVIRQTPNMQVLQMGKEGLDAMISDARDPLTGRLSKVGVALDQVRRAYLREIDSLDRNGVYAHARSLWEGPSASRDAVIAGRAALSSSPEEIAEEFGRLSPVNQEFYRVGVADKIRERLLKTGLSGDEAKAIVRNNWMRDQLRPLMRSNTEFDQFMQSVAWEAEMFTERYGVKGGPQTAARIAEDTSQENALAIEGAKIGAHVALGNYPAAGWGAIKAAVRRYQDLGIVTNQKVNAEIARILFSTPIRPGSEIYQRLSGTYAGPQAINRLGGLADVVSSAGVLAPAAGSALANPGGPF